MIKHWTNQFWWPIGLAVVLAVSGLFYISGQSGIAHNLLFAAALIGVIPIAVGMAKDVLSGKVGVDILALVAIAASLLLGENLAGVVILLMLTGGEALEDYAQERAKSELTSLLGRAPKIAHRKSGDAFYDIPVGDIKPDDILLVKPGEIVPVDGLLHGGTAVIDESAITGESLPITKNNGQVVLSGSINSDTPFEITAIHTSAESQYEQIVALVQEASSTRSPLVRLADRYSIPFTVTAFTLAGIGWYISGQPVRALEVLVVATPCPLLIATPVALVAGMSRSARHGIILKSGSALERLSRLRTVIFDKTGTLTMGVPKVTGLVPVGIGEAELLRLVASVETASSHILAGAVAAEAKARNVSVLAARNVQEVTGQGIEAVVNGKHIIIGKLEYLATRKVKAHRTSHKSAGELALYVAIDNTYRGSITFADEIRPETKQAVIWLQKLGIKRTVMLTGDGEEVAERIAAEIGIRRVYADCMPSDKLGVIKRLPKSAKPIAMVGDGVNDAPVLAAADVGIAMGARGSTAASESADVVIMLDNLSRVPMAVMIAKRAMGIARQSIWVGIGLSVILMVVAITGIIKPVNGALLQEAIDVSVILNALRARHGGRRFVA